MGDRYYITGAQLGMLKALVDIKDYDNFLELWNKIETNQFIGRIEEQDKDKMDVIIVAKNELLKPTNNLLISNKGCGKEFNNLNNPKMMREICGKWFLCSDCRAKTKENKE